jgi:hypothetical protein
VEETGHLESVDEQVDDDDDDDDDDDYHLRAGGAKARADSSAR